MSFICNQVLPVEAKGMELHTPKVACSKCQKMFKLRKKLTKENMMCYSKVVL